MKKASIKILGMHCASCALTIEKNIKKEKCIKKVSVNYANTKAYIEYDENIIKEKDMKKKQRREKVNQKKDKKRKRKKIK